MEKDLETNGLTLEEYQTLLSPKQSDPSDNATEDYSDDNEEDKGDIAKRIQKRQALREEYIDLPQFNDMIATLNLYDQQWWNSCEIQLRSATLSRSKKMMEDILGFLQCHPNDARFRRPIPRCQTHQILSKPKPNRKCKITDFLDLYCKQRPITPPEPEEETVEAVSSPKGKKSKKDKAKKDKNKNDKKSSANSTEKEETETNDSNMAGYQKIESNARFIIAAQSEIEFCIVFKSEMCQQLKEHLYFAISGAKDVFKLPVQAICALPEFDSAPKALFANLTAASKVSTHKKYVESEELYQFGALLAGIDPEMRTQLPSMIETLESEVAAFTKTEKSDSKEKGEEKKDGVDAVKKTDEEKKELEVMCLEHALQDVSCFQPWSLIS